MATDYNALFANPWLQMGLGILSANQPGAGTGPAIGQGMLGGMANYQAMQDRQRKLEELQRVQAAQAQVAQQYPQLAPILQAYPNAAPQVLGSVYASPAEAPSNVREWQYFSQLPEAERQQYLAMKRANQWLDTGGAQMMPNPLDPGRPVAVLPKTLPPQDLPAVRGMQAEAAASGRVRGETASVAETQDINVREVKRYINELKAHPGLSSSTGLSSVLPVVPGSKRADFEARRQQLLGTAFLQAYEALKGGGQITEIEGQKAEQSLARLEAATSKEDFLTALKDFERAVETGSAKIRAKAGRQNVQPRMESDQTPVQNGWSIERIE